MGAGPGIYDEAPPHCVLDVEAISPYLMAVKTTLQARSKNANSESLAFSRIGFLTSQIPVVAWQASSFSWFKLA